MLSSIFKLHDTYYKHSLNSCKGAIVSPLVVMFWLLHSIVYELIGIGSHTNVGLILK